MSIPLSEMIVTFTGVFFAIWTAGSAVVGAIAAPMLIHRADDTLGSLYPSDEILIKGLPFSFGRLATYGRLIIFRSTPWFRKRVFDKKPELDDAIERMPRGLKRALIWIYGPVLFTGALFFLFGGLLMLMRG